MSQLRDMVMLLAREVSAGCAQQGNYASAQRIISLAATMESEKETQITGSLADLQPSDLLAVGLPAEVTKKYGPFTKEMAERVIAMATGKLPIPDRWPDTKDGFVRFLKDWFPLRPVNPPIVFIARKVRSEVTLWHCDALAGAHHFDRMDASRFEKIRFVAAMGARDIDAAEVATPLEAAAFLRAVATKSAESPLQQASAGARS